MKTNYMIKRSVLCVLIKLYKQSITLNNTEICAKKNYVN